MGFGTMLAKNITGTVDKAYLMMHKPITDADQRKAENNKISSYMSQIASVGQRLASAAGAATGQEGNLADSLSEIAGDDFFTMKVQYNPSTLHLSSKAGVSYNNYDGVGGNGSGQFQVDNIPYEAVLNMELIFDDTVNSDAFSVFDAGNASETGIIKAAASTITNIATTKSLYGNHSVRNISELFVAAICNAYSRPMCVAWNKTVFWGELCGVTVEYTMFNSKGNPIRSKVRLEIRQDDRANPSPTSWEKTYNNFFTAAEELSASMKLTSSKNTISNIFNLNN